ATMYIVALRIFVYVVPTVPAAGHKAVLSIGAEHWLPTSGIGGEIICVLLILLQAILLNLMVSQYRIGKEITLFPGLIYALLVGGMPDAAHWAPVMIANTFFIVALFALFSTYKKSASAGAIFNVGLSIALASLFYYSYFWFFIMAIIGLSILRNFRLQELWTLLIGFMVPFYLTAVVYFWMDDLGGFWFQQFNANHTLLDFRQIAGIDLTIKLVLFAILVLICLLSYSRYLMKKNIQVQKNIDILFWALLFAGVSVFIQSEAGPDHLMMLAPSLAILLSLSWLDLKPPYAELAHLLLLFTFLFLQYAGYFGLI
ncbi:MAG: hypothetical protein AAFO94_13245, partial [Bacteroidota bacterium]